jgi:polyisoprenoid-binding protein YceI
MAGNALARQVGRTPAEFCGKFRHVAPVSSSNMKLGMVVALALAAGCSKGETTQAAAPAANESSAPAVVLPQPGKFQVDPTHSTVLFKVKHANTGYVYGWFKDFSGAFTIDSDPTKSSIELTVKAASLDTRDDERNTHLAGPDFLNATMFPELAFKSTKVEATKSGWRITGDMTIHGTTHQITFSATPTGDTKDPQGTRHVGLEAHVSIARSDFGVTFMPEMVGFQVDIVIALEGAAV